MKITPEMIQAGANAIYRKTGWPTATEMVSEILEAALSTQSSDIDIRNAALEEAAIATDDKLRSWGLSNTADSVGGIIRALKAEGESR